MCPPQSWGTGATTFRGATEVAACLRRVIGGCPETPDKGHEQHRLEITHLWSLLEKSRSIDGHRGLRTKNLRFLTETPTHRILRPSLPSRSGSFPDFPVSQNHQNARFTHTLRKLPMAPKRPSNRAGSSLSVRVSSIVSTSTARRVCEQGRLVFRSVRVADLATTRLAYMGST